MFLFRNFTQALKDWKKKTVGVGHVRIKSREQKPVRCGVCRIWILKWFMFWKVKKSRKTSICWWLRIVVLLKVKVRVLRYVSKLYPPSCPFRQNRNRVRDHQVLYTTVLYLLYWDAGAVKLPKIQKIKIKTDLMTLKYKVKYVYYHRFFIHIRVRIIKLDKPNLSPSLIYHSRPAEQPVKRKAVFLNFFLKNLLGNFCCKSVWD